MVVPGIVFVSVYHKHPWARAVLRWSHVKSCWSHWGRISWRLNNPTNCNKYQFNIGFLYVLVAE